MAPNRIQSDSGPEMAMDHHTKSHHKIQTLPSPTVMIPSSWTKNGTNHKMISDTKNLSSRKSLDQSSITGNEPNNNSISKLNADNQSKHINSQQTTSNNSSAPKKRRESASDRIVPDSKQTKMMKKPDEIMKAPDSSENTTAPSATVRPAKAEDTTRCHQCRLEFTSGLILNCTNQQAPKVKGGRKSEPMPSELAKEKLVPARVGPCRHKFCHKCLLTRYGEDVSGMRAADVERCGWTCPVCQDYCNCSTCRRKKGLPPTGRLLKEATEGGFTSARELLEANPNAQGADMITLASKRKEREHTKATSSKKVKTEKVTNKSQSPKKKLKPTTKLPKTPSKQVGPKRTRVKKDKNLTDLQKVKASKLKKKKKTETNGTTNEPNKSKAGKSKAQAIPTNAPALEETGPKVPTKRGPNLVLAPTGFSCIPTGSLKSDQIRSRLHVREFLIRFKSHLPGLGATEQTNSKSETQRAQKVIDSMDDLVNFWIDDEGGMKAIVAGLVRLIEKDIDQDSGDEDVILLSNQSKSILDQLKRECKTAMTTPSPYVASSVHCWNTARAFLEEEKLGKKLNKWRESIYLMNEIPDDDRIHRVKIKPEEKLAIINGLIEVALRGHTLAEDLIQGLERERQAKADISKERAKLKQQWNETRLKKVSEMPFKESLLPTADSQEKETPDLIAREKARLEAMAGWEGEMNQMEHEYKSELRLSGINQYIVGSLNRLRFQPIGKDTRQNSYYILSGTPGRLYPADKIELSYAWSYSVIIHGAEPSDSNDVIERRKKQGKNGEKKSKELNEDDQVDMLEGGQRESDDQWIRVSEPKEIRQLAAWIEYEARLIDHRQIENSQGSQNLKRGQIGIESIDKHLKIVIGLVEQIQTFAEYLELKINERDEQTDRRTVKARNAQSL